MHREITTALKARLDTVPDIGQTHGYTRYAVQMADYLDKFLFAFQGQDEVRGWVISLNPNNPISSERLMIDSSQRTYNYQIFGVMALRDEDNTEADFFDLVENIMVAVEGHLTLGLSVVLVQPIAMSLYQQRTFGSYLCHYCELSVPVQVDIAATWSGA